MQNLFKIGYIQSDELRNLSFAKTGDNVAISKERTIIGLEKINIEYNSRTDDYANISQGVRIHSKSNNYDGSTRPNPTIPKEITTHPKRFVKVGRRCIIRSGTIILSGASIDEGAVLGAVSLVKSTT